MKHSGKITIAAVAAVLLMGIGISYAWFSQHAALSTLMDILPPDSIKIYPVDADGGEMGMLDLDFKEGVDDKDTVGDDTTITIRRPVKIYSTSPVHQLEIVHTTNLNKLTFNIYPATKTDEGYSYTPPEKKALVGSYINPDPNVPSLAAKENLNNYKNNDKVEAHAYPLYWLANNSAISNYRQDGWNVVISESEDKIDPAKQVEKTYYTTYYILEISWQENSKETDLFYIMARNIDVTEKSEGSVSKP